jgi:Ni,Fe-hydrogenase III large subunit
MRLQHLEQIANALSCDDPPRAAAKAAIVGEVERLHWRLWNGKAANARISIDRIHAVMYLFKSEPGTLNRSRHRESCGPPYTRWMVI